MQISYRTSKLQRICDSDSQAKRQLGAENARKLRYRLSEIEATPTLADLLAVSTAHCHDLKGNRAGEWAVSLQGPWRLVFVIAPDPLPRTAQGGVDLAAVVAVEIVGVEDYH